MGASGQRHALAALLRQKDPVPLKVEARWAPEPKIVWGCFNCFRCLNYVSVQYGKQTCYRSLTSQ